MTAAFAFDIGLVVLIVAIAMWTLVTRDTLVAVIVFIVYGLLLSLAWVRLAAVDVALTESAIGAGVTGMLLLNAAAALRTTARERAARSAISLRLASGFFCALISVSLAVLVLFPPAGPATLAPAAMENLAESGLRNPVAGVLFVYRSLDTLLEKVVLLLALIGVWSLAPDRLWSGTPGLRLYGQRDGVLTFLAQLLPPLGVVISIYMFWMGANQPGGAFQGGAVLAAMWLLVMIAGLRDVPPISQPRMRVLLVIGPAIFLAVGFAGFVFADAFLAYPAGYAKPLIVIIEAALTLSIGVTLGLLVAGPPERTSQQ